MKGKDLKKQIIKFRTSCFEKLLKAYDITDKEKDVKICSRHGEHFIILCEKFCWREVLEFKGNTFQYKLVPYQDFFNPIIIAPPKE